MLLETKNYQKVLFTNQQGVTLIELILVIAIIGVLASVLVGVIDPQRQREYAEEASLKANLGKLCSGIEGYYEGENETLPSEGPNNNPLEAGAGDEDIAGVYLSTWPSGSEAGNNYEYNLAADGTSFSIHIQRTINNGYLKCTNFWGEIRECAASTDPTDVFACD